MMRIVGFFWVFLFLCGCVMAADQKASKVEFSAVWDGGLRFVTPDGSWRFEIFGRLDNDWAWFGYSDALEGKGLIQNGNEFRRARLGVGGTMFENIGFKIEYDFTGGEAEYKDVYVELRSVPVVGTIRVGHFYEPFYMDELMSTNHSMFLESAMPSVFGPKRNSGIALLNQALNKRMTWSAGLFRDSGTYGESANGSDEGKLNFTARITGLPYNTGDHRLMHLGVSYSMQQPKSKMLSLSIRPEIHLSSPLLKVILGEEFMMDRIDLLNLEFGFLLDRLTVQAEWTGANYQFKSIDDVSFSGYYAQAGFMFTEDVRAYNKTGGCFGAVKPKRPFNLKTGTWGAWELAIRYSAIDLTDTEVKSGKISDITAGLNWYWNANTKLMFNYIRSDLDFFEGGDGTSDMFALRLHVDF